MARHDVLVVDHPAVADRLARLRDRDAPVPIFRRMVEEIGLFLAYEATRYAAHRPRPRCRRRSSRPRRGASRRRPVVVADLARGSGPLAGLPRLHRRCRDRAPRVLPRSGHARAGAVLREHAAHPRPNATSSCSTRCSRPAIPVRPRSRCSTSRGAQRDHVRVPDRRARRHRDASVRRIPTCASSPPRSTSGSTITATSCRVSAMPATGCSARRPRCR